MPCCQQVLGQLLHQLAVFARMKSQIERERSSLVVSRENEQPDVIRADVGLTIVRFFID